MVGCTHLCWTVTWAFHAAEMHFRISIHWAIKWRPTSSHCSYFIFPSFSYYSCFPAPPPPSSSCHRYRVGRWISPRISSGWSGITTRSSFSSSSTSVRTAGLVPGQISPSANPTNLPPPLLQDYIIRHHCILYYNYNSDYIIIILYIIIIYMVQFYYILNCILGNFRMGINFFVSTSC